MFSDIEFEQFEVDVIFYGRGMDSGTLGDIALEKLYSHRQK
jgi:hypothetical protein